MAVAKDVPSAAKRRAALDAQHEKNAQKAREWAQNRKQRRGRPQSAETRAAQSRAATLRYAEQLLREKTASPIAMARIRAGLRQTDLAQAARISVKSVWKLENMPERCRPWLFTRVADVLGVPVEDLRR